MSISKLIKLILSPIKYFPLALKKAEKYLCYFFRDSAFFLQGQMDINPKSLWFSNHFSARTGGFFPQNDQAKRRIVDLEPWDTTRRDMLVLFLRTIIEKKVHGGFVELGVYQGKTAKLIHHYAPERKLHLFDTFEGFGEKMVLSENDNMDYKISSDHFADTNIEKVKRYIAAENENVYFYNGYFPDSIPVGFSDLKFAFVQLDADLFEPTFEGLKFFYPRMNRGGFIVVHDYNAWPGARKAVDDFFSERVETAVPMPDKSGSVLIIKQ
jgi:O-methyltransferase